MLGHHRTSQDITGHQRTSKDIKGHQRTSKDIKGHHIIEHDFTSGHGVASESGPWDLPAEPAVNPRPEELAGHLVEQAKADGVDLVGPDGLLGGLTKRVLEASLEAEMDEHLGYAKHDPSGRDRGNSRNGIA